jgi:hypothetical protein
MEMIRGQGVPWRPQAGGITSFAYAGTMTPTLLEVKLEGCFLFNRTIFEFINRKYVW